MTDPPGINASATQNAEQSSAAALHTRYADDLRAFSRGLTRDAELADEVVQITFEKALRSLVPTGCSGETSLSKPEKSLEDRQRGWLFRTAFNVAMELRRTSKRRRHLLQQAVWSERISLSEASAPDEGLVRQERQNAVRNELARLPEELREIVERRIYREETFAVIADSLGVPLGTVVARMKRALTMLSQSLSSLMTDD